MANERATGAAVAAIPLAISLLTGFVGTDGPARSTTTNDPSANETFASGRIVAGETATGFLNVYFGNLHAHTSYSDGVKLPGDAFAHARDVAGLDFMLLSEHNHAQAGRIANENALYSGSQASSLISTANRMTENGEFVALYGQEFSTISAGNHINVLDVPRVIDVDNGEFGELLNSWLPTNPDSSGGQAVMLLNHPDTSNSPNDIEYGRDDFGSEAEWVRRMGNEAHLIAMINGPSHQAGTGLPPSRPAEGEFFRYLGLGFHIAPTADQDNHRATWGATTNARTAVIADDLSKASLLKAMRARHVYATEDKNLRIVCRVNGQLCGERLSATPGIGAELQAELTIHDDDEPAATYEVDVFLGTVGAEPSRSPVDTVEVTGNTTTPLRIEDIRYGGGNQFLFFRIRQLNDDDDAERAWTAPIWIGAIAPVTPATSTTQLVASRLSKIYHNDPTCKSAQAIKAANRLTGSEAKKGRSLHAACPL